MSDLRRRFEASELDGDDAELAGLLRTARDLESFAASEHAAPSADFEDRVMAAIAAEPAPRAVMAGGFIATVRNAWRLAWSGGRPMAVRAQAFALLLIVAVAFGSVGSLAVVGAARLLTPPVSPPPTVLPTPSPSPSVPPSPSPSPSVVPSPSVSPSPSPTPSATDTEEPSGTDDHGGGSGSGSGDDSSGSGSGSGSDDKTREPAETLKPGETPESGDDSGHDSRDDH
jgi:uncharacterized membrane protein YgcG